MLTVGLSGGIGSGKSTVARRLAELGAVIIDADVLSREVLAAGTDGLAELVAHFGEDVVNAQGELDRPAMARKVFGDADARSELNAIVHPRVRRRTTELVKQAPADAIVVHDVPLLVENGYAPDYHLVLIVHAPVEERVARLAERGLSEDDARSRIDAQATDPQRREVADVWLDNGGPVADLLRSVDQLWEQRLVPFEKNVRAHRRVPKRPPRIVEHDPEWPQAAHRLIARIERATSQSAVRVDHIGSTSVPGLDAKDIIDLQISVRSLADADALAEPLGDAGFPVIAGIDGDTAHAIAPDPQQWAKRVHTTADPGRYANVHLRVPGTYGWWWAFLFRDWLRAQPDARAEYAAMKHAAAQLHAEDGDHDAYTDAKEPWFADAVPRAAAWAQREGWRPPRVE